MVFSILNHNIALTVYRRFTYFGNKRDLGNCGNFDTTKIQKPIFLVIEIVSPKPNVSGDLDKKLVPFISSYFERIILICTKKQANSAVRNEYE